MERFWQQQHIGHSGNFATHSSLSFHCFFFCSSIFTNNPPCSLETHENGRFITVPFIIKMVELRREIVWSHPCFCLSGVFNACTLVFKEISFPSSSKAGYLPSCEIGHLCLFVFIISFLPRWTVHSVKKQWPTLMSIRACLWQEPRLSVQIAHRSLAWLLHRFLLVCLPEREQ